MQNIQFRKCKLEDWQYLRNTSVKTFINAFGKQNTKENMEVYLSTAFTSEKVKEELSNPFSFFYFATSEEETVGYLKLNIENAQTEPVVDALEIERIYLFSTYQGQGIGQIMMDKAFEVAREKRKRKLWLGVWKKNYGAIRFYERNGFKKFADHNFYLGKDLQTDWLMETSLENG